MVLNCNFETNIWNQLLDIYFIIKILVQKYDKFASAYLIIGTQNVYDFVTFTAE